MGLDPQTAPRPDGLADLIRRVEDIERKQKSDLASVSQSFKDTVATLTDLVGKAVDPVADFANASNYAIPAGQANRVTRATISFTVPSGFTRALVYASASDGAVNSTASPDYLYSYLAINPGNWWGQFPSSTAPAGTFAMATVSMDAFITGLTGGSVVTVQSQPYSLIGAWAANTSNQSAPSAMCIFLR